VHSLRQAGMYSWTVRTSVVFFFALTCLFVAAVGSAVTALWHVSNPVIKLSASNLQLKRTQSGNDLARFKIDLDADLGSVWNWNVKQLFVYILVEHETENTPKNQVVVWDYIAKTQDTSHIFLSKQPLKYGLMAHQDTFRDTKANVTVNWDIMPIIGILKSGSSAPFSISLREQPTS